MCYQTTFSTTIIKTLTQGKSLGKPLSTLAVQFQRLQIQWFMVIQHFTKLVYSFNICIQLTLSPKQLRLNLTHFLVCNADVLGGYNGTIFAYGQTSSGKTHTMEVRKIMEKYLENVYSSVLYCSDSNEILVNFAAAFEQDYMPS